VRSGVAVAHQFFGSDLEVLFRTADALFEGWRRGRVEYFDPTARAFGDIHPVQAGVFFTTTRGHDPDLSRRQRVAADAVFIVEFRGRSELFHAIIADGVAELGVAKFRGP